LAAVRIILAIYLGLRAIANPKRTHEIDFQIFQHWYRFPTKLVSHQNMASRLLP